MAKLQIKREILEKARDRSILSDEEKEAIESLLGHAAPRAAVTANARQYPLALLRALLDDTRLTPSQRAQVAMVVHGMTSAQDVDREEIYETVVSSPTELGSAVMLLGRRSPNCEMFLNGRWYPVVLNVLFLQDSDHLSRGAWLHANLALCDTSIEVAHCVYKDLFLDGSGRPRDHTVLEVLQHFGFRRLETSPQAYNLKLVRAERASREHGKQVLVTGSVVVNSKFAWWSRLEPRPRYARAAPQGDHRARTRGPGGGASLLFTPRPGGGRDQSTAVRPGLQPRHQGVCLRRRG